jgi:hypothetical protein
MRHHPQDSHDRQSPVFTMLSGGQGHLRRTESGGRRAEEGLQVVVGFLAPFEPRFCTSVRMLEITEIDPF